MSLNYVNNVCPTFFSLVTHFYIYEYKNHYKSLFLLINDAVQGLELYACLQLKNCHVFYMAALQGHKIQSLWSLYKIL